MTRSDAWKEVYDRFDPEQPVSRPEWRADRLRSPVGRILTQLESPFGPPRALLLGTTGTGKSTELLRIAEARAPKDLVVHIDLVRHFDEVVGDLAALQRLSAWEVCFLTGLAVIRAARDAWGHPWDDAQIQALGVAWRALAQNTTEAPTIDIGKLVGSMLVLASSAVSGPAGASLTALATTAGALRWAAPIGTGGKAPRDQDTRVRDLLNAVNSLIEALRNQYRKRILIIIDGLDRITDVAHARALFIDSEIISHLDSPLVIAGPFVLRHHLAAVMVRKLAPYTLVNEPVLDNARRLLEMGIHKGHIQLLKQIAEDPHHQLPDDDKVWELLGTLRLLPYPNESEWFYPHPLLTRHLVRPDETGSSPSV